MKSIEFNLEKEMKIALVGYGNMGKAIEKAAKESNIPIVARIFRSAPLAVDRSISKEALCDADVAIECTHPSAVLSHVQALAECQIPIVIGTSGWYDRIADVEQMARQHQVGVLYAENFSLGMNLFLEVVQSAAHALGRWDKMDVSVVESHHKEKKDMPSGTATRIVRELLHAIPRKTEAKTALSSGKIDPQVIQVASIRQGYHPGQHEVLFDSPYETISLTHRARNREGLAWGALQAAHWIREKKGLYHIREMFTLNSKVGLGP